MNINNNNMYYYHFLSKYGGIMSNFTIVRIFFMVKMNMKLLKIQIIWKKNII